MNKTKQRTKSTLQLNYLEIIVLVISILTHLLFLSTLTFSTDYSTRLVSSVQIRLAENSVAPSNQVHLPSIIQFPESSLEVQQIVDLDVISEVAFDVIEMPTEAVPPKDEVELDLEKLIQESESKLSLIPMPSASFPKGDPNDAPGTTALNLNLATVAGKERQNVGRLNTPSFSEIKSKDKESSGKISKQEQGRQFENQSYEIRTDERKPTQFCLKATS